MTPSWMTSGVSVAGLGRVLTDATNSMTIQACVALINKSSVDKVLTVSFNVIFSAEEYARIAQTSLSTGLTFPWRRVMYDKIHESILHVPWISIH